MFEVGNKYKTLEGYSVEIFGISKNGNVFGMILGDWPTYREWNAKDGRVYYRHSSEVTEGFATKDFGDNLKVPTKKVWVNLYESKKALGGSKSWEVVGNFYKTKEHADEGQAHSFKRLACVEIEVSEDFS